MQIVRQGETTKLGYFLDWYYNAIGVDWLSRRRHSIKPEWLYKINLLINKFWVAALAVEASPAIGLRLVFSLAYFFNWCQMNRQNDMMCVCAQAAGYAVWPVWQPLGAQAGCPARFAALGSEDCASRPADTNRGRRVRSGAGYALSRCRIANRWRHNICRSPSRCDRGFWGK